MRRLTKAKARILLRRELGMSNKALSTLEDKTQNPDHPQYECDLSGKVHVSLVGMSVYSGNYKLVALSMYFEDGSIHTSYFYADTLEPCEKYREATFWNNIWEAAEGRDLDIAAVRAENAAMDDLRRHYNHKKGV